MMRYYGGFGYNMIAMGVMSLVALLVLALLVVGIILIVRMLRRPHQSGVQNNFQAPANNSALNILNERYAKGEITDEEYQRKKAQILS